MVIRVHGHHLLLGLRLNDNHINHFGLYPRQTQSVKSEKLHFYNVYKIDYMDFGKTNSLVIVVPV